MSWLTKLNPRNWFAKKAAAPEVPVVEPEPEEEEATPLVPPGTFVETLALAQFAFREEHGHFKPIRDTEQHQSRAWRQLGIKPPKNLTWVKTYCNEWGDGYEIWQRRTVDGRIESRMFHLGPDKTRESRVEWSS